MIKNNIHITKVNKREKFWFHNIRSMNYFAYRYWWLLLLLFILYLILWYLFCFRVPYQQDCSSDKNFNQTVENIKAKIDSCCDCDNLPISGLKWDLINKNPCSNQNWIISQNNTILRYNIIDSKNCGGPCASVQSGSAKANITVADKDVMLDLDFDGIGELQHSNYELIKFYLDGVLVADAHAAGGNLGCQYGPVIKKYYQKSPYKLLKGSNHLFEVHFTTNDENYHKECYYEVRLKLMTL